jgi:hypothetical protein
MADPAGAEREASVGIPLDAQEKGNMMRNRFYLLALPVVFVMAAGTTATAGPLRVQSAGGGTACAVVCPHCGHPMVTNQTGDYTITFSGDEIHPKTGAARFEVGVLDRDGKPVSGAEVELTLSMPAHHHGPVTLPVKAGTGGRYTASTNLNPHMRGQWSADVRVTTPKGEKLTQTFAFDQ